MQTQEIREPIRIGKIITINDNSIPEQPKNWNRPRLSGSARPPYVQPVKSPDEIISDIFTYEDREMFIKAIISKQKTGAEWENIRAKLPEQFLDKLKKVMQECWENGFCRPQIRNGELVWSQIKGDERKMNHPEQCDLCRNSFQSGTCKGRIHYNFKGQRNFKKCWER